jgi:hypothetical protein
MDLRPEITREERCRCGHPASSSHPHPCHAKGYACREPARQRFYNPYPPGVPGASLAGTQMKVCLADTWACDECWAQFKAEQE